MGSVTNRSLIDCLDTWFISCDTVQVNITTLGLRHGSSDAVSSVNLHSCCCTFAVVL